jgi:hypothetical protein
LIKPVLSQQNLNLDDFELHKNDTANDNGGLPNSNNNILNSPIKSMGNNYNEAILIDLDGLCDDYAGFELYLKRIKLILVFF